MTELLPFIFGFLGLALLFCIILQFRNNRVLKYSLYLIDLISEIDEEEINQGVHYTGWRLQELRTVSYKRRVLMFWKPLDSFYKDKAFFKEIQKRRV
jgi:hypothetical protein